MRPGDFRMWGHITSTNSVFIQQYPQALSAGLLSINSSPSLYWCMDCPSSNVELVLSLVELDAHEPVSQACEGFSEWHPFPPVHQHCCSAWSIICRLACFANNRAVIERYRWVRTHSHKNILGLSTRLKTLDDPLWLERFFMVSFLKVPQTGHSTCFKKSSIANDSFRASFHSFLPPLLVLIILVEYLADSDP